MQHIIQSDVLSANCFSAQLTLEADPVLDLIGAIVLQTDILVLDAVVVILVEVAPVVIVTGRTVNRNLLKLIYKRVFLLVLTLR